MFKLLLKWNFYPRIPINYKYITKINTYENIKLIKQGKLYLIRTSDLYNIQYTYSNFIFAFINFILAWAFPEKYNIPILKDFLSYPKCTTILGMQTCSKYEEVNNIFNSLEPIISIERVRNENGESAFPLERPKTCTPIINLSEKIKGVIDDGMLKGSSEFQYCPTDIFGGIKPKDIFIKQIGDLNE